MCVAGLNQPNYLNNGNKLLDLVFTDFADISIDLPEYGANQPDHFRLLFIADCITQIRSSRCF
jgi:hypothetical protein